MTLSREEVARAWSGLRFREVYDQLDPAVWWLLMGGGIHRGRTAVVATCEDALASLEGTRTHFRQVRTVVGESTVVVQTIADYVHDEGTDLIGCCDLYDFVGDTLVGITSHTSQLDDDEVRD